MVPERLTTPETDPYLYRMETASKRSLRTVAPGILKQKKTKKGNAMKLIIHDLDAEMAEQILSNEQGIHKIANHNEIHQCIGCFGCWTKTPGQCVIKDDYDNIGELFSKSDEIILVSKCFYGGFSPFVKNIIDRGISYSHPYFVKKNGEMHHRRRYTNHFDLSFYFYGEHITEKEKKTAEALSQANAVNLHSNVKQVCFASTPQEFGDKL